MASDGRFTESFDAVVVGSGYGGSVAACRMAMAGIHVCLVEKGRRWESQDFPTNTFQMLAAAKMEWSKWGLGFGPKDALFQIRMQEDSVAAVACGLGGGSLVNAGVIIPAPARTRRDPRWPKEWEQDWDSCEASASAMLRPQSVPTEFASGKVVGPLLLEEEMEDFSNSSNPIKVTMNFEQGEEQKSNATGGYQQQLGSCLACGNCLSGCPYNAKNSTDKNYLAFAIKNGCVVRTQHQVVFVVRNAEERGRRWRVYFDDIEYICADHVVLSGGALGTAEILFRSRNRGLRLSERLGFGFSCNGNNVAYVAGSTAPLNGYGLNKKQFSKIPLIDRPGPSISSSYTSSLGFTVQTGVLPTAYPYLLFKGITTYGWPPCFGLFRGVVDKLKYLLGLKSSQAILLNLMGHDDGDGRITFDEEYERLQITAPHDALLSRKILALQRITKKLGGLLFMSRYRSTAVHHLGGCNASPDSLRGVCNPSGQVFDPSRGSDAVHEGLYVCDASLIPCSVGINPCLTITTAAEHVSRQLVQDAVGHKLQSPIHYNRIQPTSEIFDDSYVTIKETMRGYVGGMPCTAYLTMKMDTWDPKSSDAESFDFGGPHPLLKGRVGGYITLPPVDKDKLYIVDGRVDMCNVDPRTPFTQYMKYDFTLASSSGSRYVFHGKKVMNPYLLFCYAWRESTTLHVTLKKIRENDSNGKKIIGGHVEGEVMEFTGELHVSVMELLKSLASLKGRNRGNFLRQLSQSLVRTYIIQIPREITDNSSSPAQLDHEPYPTSNLYELKTGDGCIITCRHWKCSQNRLGAEEERSTNPVLLLNGHSTESFWLPTEPRDLVRTLLEEGYDTWLLEPRFHPSHPSNDFTIEDIGKFDIPAAFAKMFEVYGSSTRVHVIAHCVGGLSIHIGLMGGHISAKHVASLSCTNSSMFFKVTTSSLVKMRLPLIPISMAILGENNILPLTESSTKDSSRQWLLKSVAQLIPRSERCTCVECEVFSGIFGNTFWHENVSATMHHWLNKQSSTSLPMSAFPHLRKICLSGHIIDSQGNNSYLIHPERMAVHTLYVSGGKSLLVTPETSLLANRYMRLHQPEFCHRRVVVDGFGHSDLLIGEDSYKKVFPHLLSHIKRVEKGAGNGGNAMDDPKHGKQTQSWACGPCDGQRWVASWVLRILLLLVIFMFLRGYPDLVLA